MTTEPTNTGIATFLTSIRDSARKRDCIALLDIMKQATQTEPKMWGASIVGFGDLHYKYDSGREGDAFLLGFASRKTALTLYLNTALATQEEMLNRLGEHTTGKGCLYIRSLEDIDLSVLRSLLVEAAAHNAATATPHTTSP